MENRLKILVFIDWYLPGTKSGGPVRSVANLIDYFNNDYEFRIITRNTDYCETEVYKNIISDDWNKIDKNTSVFYFSHEHLTYNNLKQLIDATDFDIAYVNGIYSKFFSLLPVYLLRNSNMPVVVAARGMLNPHSISVKSFKKKLFLKLINLTGFYKRVSFHATNMEEANHINEFISKSRRITVAPNLPRKLEGNAFIPKGKNSIVKFCSVARIAREKGTLTALQALAGLSTSNNVIYDIYGPIYAQNYWDKCQEVIKILPGNIKVNYKGSIESDEVPNLLSSYDFFLMPSEGENYGHGIVEAFTAGCPVIISDNTPWKNLISQKVGWDVSLENLSPLVSALDEAINMDDTTYQIWSENAFVYSNKIINNEEILEANRSLFLLQ